MKKYFVQSIIFDKDIFNVTKAKQWLKKNNYRIDKVDKTDNMFRFRQQDPNEIEQEGFTEYRTKKLGDSGISLILAYNKKIISNNNMNNNWIQHVKDFASKKGISYRDALRDVECKSTYKKGGMCGAGVIDEVPNQALIAQQYNTKQLGQQAGKKFISL